MNVVHGLSSFFKWFIAVVIGMSCDNVTIVTRQEWGARPPKNTATMSTPVGFVFVHHTAMSECHNENECSKELRIIQDFHMDNRSKLFILVFCLLNFRLTHN